ncbi:MAG TPA: SRPBCC family protein [Caldimonas sp.]
MSRFQHDLDSQRPLLRRAAIRRLVVGLLVACGAAGTLAGGKEVSVSEKVDVAAPPAKTWNTIKDFDGWQEWHPAFARTEITQGLGNTEGTVRVLTAKDGARFTEELVAFSATSRTYRYRIVESPAPISDYVSTLQVKPHKDGSTVVWSSHFKVNPGTSDAEAKQAITGIYRVGLDHLATVLH